MGKELQILILEDVAADAELIERELRKGGIAFLSKRVETKKAFLKEIKDFTPDIILADYTLPSFDGLSALKIAKERCPDVPFIFVSGTIGEELAVETLKRGAIDYVLKDRLSRLVPALNRALREVKERAERKRSEKALQYRVEFENLITVLSTNFINVAPEDLDKWINLALQTIGEFAGVDRSYVFLFSKKGMKMDNTHEWCAEGIEPQIQRLKNLSVNAFPWFAKRIKKREIIYIPRVIDLPPEANAEKEEFHLSAIQSLINVPMVYRGILVGFLGFDSVRKEKVWSKDSIVLLKIVGEIFVNALERKRTEDLLIESESHFRQWAEKTHKSRDAFLNMLEDISESYKELEELFMSLVRAMVNALDAKSPWTKGHSERVAAYAERIAKEMGLHEEEVKNLRLAAILHDIGKIGTYDYLLDKPARLTDEEFDIVKRHPTQGVNILKDVRQLKDIIPFIRHHHERIDGSGYPDGLKGEEIPLCARILHVADSFDSMTADRPYRPAPGKGYAFLEFKRCKGTQFDPWVAKAALKAL